MRFDLIQKFSRLVGKLRAGCTELGHFQHDVRFVPFQIRLGKHQNLLIELLGGFFHIQRCGQAAEDIRGIAAGLEAVGCAFLLPKLQLGFIMLDTQL